VKQATGERDGSLKTRNGAKNSFKESASGFVPIVHLLEIDGKIVEFDRITAIVAQRAQHDQ
jgi:hypothetical protein